MGYTHKGLISRRRFLAGGMTTVLAGCSVDLAERRSGLRLEVVPQVNKEQFDPQVIYASIQDGDYTLPAVGLNKLKPQFRRQIVRSPVGSRPGNVVVDLAQAHLYFIQANGFAVRYGIGIGREGFGWSGLGVINHVRSWPKWTPTPSMLSRHPELRVYRGGMAGGLENPLGARALYIYQNGQDTLYRVHGTPEWWTIGRAMSSGCIRMLNQDVIDLSQRVDANARILVR
ncbi:MAG: L,D-transpeptidase [Pseudomonadota bacterium]